MCAQVRSASICSRASCARGPACWASDTPRCASRVRCRCAAVSVASRRISPALIAAEQIRKNGRMAASAISSPPPSAPSIADSGTTTPSAVSGADALPRSPSPSNAPGRRQARRAGRHQPQRHRPGRVGAPVRPVRAPRQRPARPDVAVRVPGRGDPALGRVEPHGRPARQQHRGGHRRPEVGPRPGLGERQRGQVRPGRDRDQRVLVTGRDQPGDRRVVHRHHHRGGPADRAELADHHRRLAQPRAAAAVLGGHGQREDPGRAERVELRPGKRAVGVHRRRSRRHDLVDDPLEGVADTTPEMTLPPASHRCARHQETTGRPTGAAT